MENKEIMLEEVVESVDTSVTADALETSGGSKFGKTVAVGAGLLFTGYVLYKAGKKVIGYFKAKNQAKIEASTVDSEDYYEPENDEVEA